MFQERSNMALWQISSSDGGLANIETIRLSTYETIPTSTGDRYTTVMSSENGTETLANYKTQEAAETGHSAYCKQLGLKQ